jgi:hypothetical protein
MQGGQSESPLADRNPFAPVHPDWEPLALFKVWLLERDDEGSCENGGAPDYVVRSCDTVVAMVTRLRMGRT